MRAEIYPDSDDTADPLGNGPDGLYDRVEYSYNRQGEQTTKKDPNGTVHQYPYDGLGRETEDRITTLGTDVDGSVRRIARSYEVRGMVAKITSYDAATGGNAVNEVLFEYDETGRLVKEYQEHAGAKDVNTPYVGYNYDTSASGGQFTKGLRPTSVCYPNGRLVHYTYGTSGGTADATNRIDAICDDSGGSPGDTLAQYSYLGTVPIFAPAKMGLSPSAGAIVQVDYPEPDLRYDLAHGSGDDPYDGMDRFGRVVDLLWRNYGTEEDAVRIKHGYDRAGNRLWREDPIAASYGKHFDELYSYDGIYQLVNMERGDLNASKDAIAEGTKTFAEEWSLDMTGNWSTYKKDDDGDGTWDLDQSRTHNQVNEITQIADSSSHVAHDLAGNMTRIPKPDDWNAHFDLTYDAWNRLVKVEDGEATVAEYAYDGRNFRTVKRLYENGQLSEVRHFHYNDGWQCLEERIGTSTDADRQFVWGLRYVDDLLLRDRDTSDPKNGVLDERLYALQDANLNVTALAGTNGTIQERYTYTVYGRPAFLTTAFAARDPNSSAYAWQYFYTGRQYDAETGLMHYRNRYYHSELGTFASRDPLEYEAEDFSLYRYVLNSPTNATDPEGTEIRIIIPGGWTPGHCPQTCKDSPWGSTFDTDWIREYARDMVREAGIRTRVITPMRCGGTNYSLACPAVNPRTGQRMVLVCIPRSLKSTCEAMALLEHEFVHVEQFANRDNRSREELETEAYTRQCEVYAEQQCLQCETEDEKKAWIRNCVDRLRPQSLGRNVGTITNACHRLNYPRGFRPL